MADNRTNLLTSDSIDPWLPSYDLERMFAITHVIFAFKVVRKSVYDAATLLCVKHNAWTLSESGNLKRHRRPIGNRRSLDGHRQLDARHRRK